MPEAVCCCYKHVIFMLMNFVQCLCTKFQLHLSLYVQVMTIIIYISIIIYYLREFAVVYKHVDE